MAEHKMCFSLQQDVRSAEETVWLRSILAAAESTPVRYGNYGYLYRHTVYPETIQRRAFTSFGQPTRLITCAIHRIDVIRIL